MLVEQAGLANQIEADVGHGNVFFQHRPVAAPLAIALTQHHRVVGQMQQIIELRHHMCPTSSGMV